MAVPRIAGIAPLAVSLVLVLVLALATAACTPLVREAAPPPAAAKAAERDGFPRRHNAQAAARGEPVLRMASAHSLVSMTVRRGGSLGHLGHDRVVASGAVQGYVAPREGR